MYHCSSDKLEFMTTQRECIAILNSYNAPFEVNALEEIRQHFNGWSAAYKLQTRIGFQHPCNECSMVGLHMVSHQIIRLATTQCSFQILLPLFALATVGSIQYCYLLIVNEIGIITHALGHYILTLKQIDVEIVDSDVLNAITHNIYNFNYSLPFPLGLSPIQPFSDDRIPDQYCCLCWRKHWQQTDLPRRLLRPRCPQLHPLQAFGG